MKITVRIAHSAVVTLSVKLSDTILSVKEAVFIRGLETPRPAFQIIKWLGLILHDDSTLQDYNIADGASLELLTNGQRGFTLRIRNNGHGNSMHTDFKVGESDSVLSVKTRFAERIGISPPLQILLYQGQILEEDSLLSDYGFQSLSEYVNLIVANPSPTSKTPMGPCRQIPIRHTKNTFFQILLGVYSPSSPLSIFQKDLDALRLIFETLKESMQSQIKWTNRGLYIPRPVNETQLPPPLLDESNEFLTLNVNMMPIVMGNPQTLPENCQRYSRLIDACLNVVGGEKGKVGYLTVHESWVEPGETQRRPGLHVESPGTLKVGTTTYKERASTSWGGGRYSTTEVKGGIFMASSVSDMCAIWPCLVKNAASVSVDSLGGMKHLKKGMEHESLAGGSEKKIHLVKANTLVWITDRTPHESLPVQKRVFRQFFRLVTSNVNVWFMDHSTANPLGVEPKCKVIKGNKFGKSSQLSVDA
ncbi:UNVERIFIED_CONTAM: hypothetical protein HDU68_001745 [Siphonaria sp. JEL0065]|nr:hypothetical protein HDU68_001745 [Siphonaria sp. JEL0065]